MLPQKGDVFVDSKLADGVVKGFMRKVAAKNARNLTAKNKEALSRVSSRFYEEGVSKKKVQSHFSSFVTLVSTAQSVFVIRPPHKTALCGIFAELFIYENEYEEYLTFQPTLIDYKTRNILTKGTSVLTSRLTVRSTHVLSRMLERQNSVDLSSSLFLIMVTWYLCHSDIHDANERDATLLLPDGGYLLGCVEHKEEYGETVVTFVGKTYLPEKHIKQRHKDLCVNARHDFDAEHWDEFVSCVAENNWLRV